MSRWTTRFARYAGAVTLVVGVTLVIGLPLLPPEGRRGLVFSAGVAILVQLASFGVLAAFGLGTPASLAAWAGGILARFVVVGGAAFLVVAIEGIDPTVALLALAGLFFVMLLLEPWALRERENSRTNR